MTETDHLMNWTAAGWLGGIAVLALAGLLGAAAVFLGRLVFWDSVKDGIVRWGRVALAFALWVMSIWGLGRALGALARHSRSLSFSGTAGMIGVVVITLAYMFAAKLANRVCEDIARFHAEPGWLPATWIVPALSGVLVCIVTQVRETSTRDLWAVTAVTALVSAAVFSLVLLGLVVWIKHARHRGLVR